MTARTDCDATKVQTLEPGRIGPSVRGKNVALTFASALPSYGAASEADSDQRDRRNEGTRDGGDADEARGQSDG